MSITSEDGYILASVTVVMVILSMAAIALMTASTGELVRVSRMDREQVQQSQLRSAIVMATSQIVLAPRQRSLRLIDGRGTLNVDGTSIAIQITYESDKVDLNQAPLDVVRATAQSGGLSQGDTSAMTTALLEMTLRNEPITLVDDVLVRAIESQECVRELFTVFGGRLDGLNVRGQSTDFERPAAGSRLSVSAWLPEQNQAASAVLLITGQRTLPARTMDWRWISGEDANLDMGGCEHAA
ncbi:MAG: hypothetical protein P8P99_08735 [Maricaulis sp.]|nr:hypothetical protein [Maricaulis sp.]